VTWGYSQTLAVATPTPLVPHHAAVGVGHRHNLRGPQGWWRWAFPPPPPLPIGGGAEESQITGVVSSLCPLARDSAGSGSGRLVACPGGCSASERVAVTSSALPATQCRLHRRCGVDLRPWQPEMGHWWLLRVDLACLTVKSAWWSAVMSSASRYGVACVDNV
jgi:hypothetical protein